MTRVGLLGGLSFWPNCTGVGNQTELTQEQSTFFFSHDRLPLARVQYADLPFF